MNIHQFSKLLAERFLVCKLPEDFNPDGGITFNKKYNVGTEFEKMHEPTGTNLFTFDQAHQMFFNILSNIYTTYVTNDKSIKDGEFNLVVSAAYRIRTSNNTWWSGEGDGTSANDFSSDPKEAIGFETDVNATKVIYRQLTKVYMVFYPSTNKLE